MPVWLRLCAPANILVVSLDAGLVADVSIQNGNPAGDVGLAIAVTDWKIHRLAGLFERELQDGGSSGRLYLESLGAALAVHLLRYYGQTRR